MNKYEEVLWNNYHLYWLIISVMSFYFAKYHRLLLP